MGNGIIYSNSENFEKDVLKCNLPVVVAFYSEDCPPCASFINVFKRSAEIYGEHMRFVMIHRQHNRQLAESLSIKSSPTVLFFENGKELCFRMNGYINNPEFKKAVEKVIGGECKNKERQKIYCDVLILGGGPAGLSAAMYSARAKLFTVVIDEGLTGGQVSTTYHVANYPGTNGVVRGMDLMENMKRQALEFGAQIDELKLINNINLEGNEKYVETDDTDYYAKAVIIATGAVPRKLPAEGEEEYRGRGVHYCATCDGAMYQDANVFVVGGGEAALEEAVFLTRYAKHVTIINRSDKFRASKGTQDEAMKNPNISVILDTVVRKVNGDTFMKSIEIENVKTNEIKEIEADGLFVYIGTEPKTDFLKGKLKLSENGYIDTDENMKTDIPGVFAAGDVRNKTVRQIATATGDGVIAGVMAERYVNGK